MHSKLDAYFTVEAAMVVPSIIYITIMVVFLFLYQYDRCLLEQDLGMIALSVNSEGYEERGVLANRLRNRTSNLNINKYVMWCFDNIDISIKNNKVNIEAEGHLSAPKIDFFGMNLKLSTVAMANKKIAIVEPAAYLRLCRKLKEESDAN